MVQNPKQKGKEEWNYGISVFSSEYFPIFYKVRSFPEDIRFLNVSKLSIERASHIQLVARMAHKLGIIFRIFMCSCA